MILEDLAYAFTCGRSDNESNLYPYIDVSKDTTIREAYDQLRTAYNTESVNEHFLLKVKDTKKNVEGIIPVIFGGDINEQYDAPELPKELAKLGVPSYEGRNVSYTLQKLYEFQEQDYSLKVDNTNARELSNYINKLVSNGFTKVTSKIYGYDNMFKKNYGNDKTLFLVARASANLDTDHIVIIDVYISPRPTNPNSKTSTFPNDTIRMSYISFKYSQIYL